MRPYRLAVVIWLFCLSLGTITYFATTTTRTPSPVAITTSDIKSASSWGWEAQRAAAQDHLVKNGWTKEGAEAIAAYLVSLDRMGISVQEALDQLTLPHSR